jgi:hypothetical protein
MLPDLDVGRGELAPRVGDSGSSRGAGGMEATSPRGVQELVGEAVVSITVDAGVGVGVPFWASLEGVPMPFVGEVVGVVECRRGEGEEGDSGRRKGEARGELKERGEGL